MAAREEPKPLSLALKEAATKALGGGIPGAAAMVIQVLTLMWLRTTINYQYAHGGTMLEALTKLYGQGGVARFYQGLSYALLLGPISRFGDTAAHAGMMSLLSRTTLPVAAKTLTASGAASLFRILLTPLDTFKTVLQTEGSLRPLAAKYKTGGLAIFFDGALANSFATLIGHYPWFLTQNFLNMKLPEFPGPRGRMLRNAFMGLCSSAISDCTSNSVRVVKTAKQASRTPISYTRAASNIIKSDGFAGLMFRGLGAKILTNAIQAMLFTILWKEFERILAEKRAKDKKRASEKRE